MSIKVLDDYEVHESTFALLPSYHHDFSTIVIEMHHVFGVRKTALQLLNVACLNGGADYAGRRKAVIHKMGSIHKVPIPVDPANFIYAFPTHASNHPDCAWLFLQHIHDVQDAPRHKGSTKIYFPNGTHTLVKASRNTIINQMNRTSRCLIHFSQPFSKQRLIHSKAAYSFLTHTSKSNKTKNCDFC